MLDFNFYLNQFSAEKNICNYLRLLSCDIWDRIGFTFGRNTIIRINEITITENVAFYIVRYLEYFNDDSVLIEMATDEQVNGNDLLIYVQLMDGFYYPIAIQSKKISSDGNYHAFKGEYEQLKKLKQFSTENGYIPMYLLYNFIDKHSRTFSMCGIKFEWNQFGCTLVNLSDVEEVCIKTKKKTGKEYLRLPHFDDFHPAYAHPFFKLVCCENVLTGIDNFKKEFRNKLQYEIKSVQLTELQSSNYWRKLSLREQHRDMYQTTSENSRKDFAPRFRFIFSNSWLKK